MVETHSLSIPKTPADTSVYVRHATLLGLVLFAVWLRLLVRLSSPHLIYADEIFQSVEQAHRLLFGTGQVPWEFEVGIRSWLLPGILAPFMWLGHQLGPSPDTLELPILVFMAIASTAPVICGFLWGERFGGLLGAVVTGALSAIWIDNVYFATHTLSEVLAADTLVVALYLGYPGTSKPSPKRLLAAGLVFGLTFALRFHLAPIILLALIWIGREHRRHVRSLVAGFLLTAVLSGLLDWATWSYPFQSVWLNIWLNVFKHISGDYGQQPEWFYFIAPMYFWGGACGLVALFAFAGSYRLPQLLIVPFLLLATMTVFQHKEYRFIYPAIPLIIILAGLGTTETLQIIWQRFGKKSARRFTLGALAICFWAITCLSIAMSPAFQPRFTSSSAMIAAFHAISASPEICGVALYRFETLTLGMSGLPPQVTLDDVDDAHLSKEADGFNAILTEVPNSIPDTRFQKRACWTDRDDITVKPIETACLWVRPGACKLGAAQASRLPWPKSWTDAVLPQQLLERSRDRDRSQISSAFLAKTR